MREQRRGEREVGTECRLAGAILKAARAAVRPGAGNPTGGQRDRWALGFWRAAREGRIRLVPSPPRSRQLTGGGDTRMMNSPSRTLVKMTSPSSKKG